jgi:hypothetical protein
MTWFTPNNGSAKSNNYLIYNILMETPTQNNQSSHMNNSTSVMPYKTTALVGLSEELRAKQSILNESEGRTYLMDILKLNEGDKIEFTEDRWSRIDAIVTRASGSIFIIEIKVRRAKSDQFPTFVMEQGKYQAGLRMAGQKGATYLYINFFEDSKALIWNVNNLVEGDDYYLDKTVTYNQGKAISEDRTRLFLYRQSAIKKEYDRACFNEATSVT